MKNNITIYADVSYDPPTKYAAWAYLIMDDDGTAADSKMFTRPIKDTSLAELLAFERALSYVNTRVAQQERPETKLTICLDNMWTVNVLNGQTDPNRAPIVAKAILHNLRPYTYEVLHVRAHTEGADIPSQYNEWCDKRAKETLRNELVGMVY